MCEYARVQMRLINLSTLWWDEFGTLPLQFITEAFGSTPLKNFISFNYTWHSSSQAHWVPALLLAICLSLISLTLMLCSFFSSEISVAHSSHTERRCGGNDLCSVLLTSIIHQMDKSRRFYIITAPTCEISRLSNGTLKATHTPTQSAKSKA